MGTHRRSHTENKMRRIDRQRQRERDTHTKTGRLNRVRGGRGLRTIRVTLWKGGGLRIENIKTND